MPRVPRPGHAAVAALACLGLLASGAAVAAPPEVAPLSLQLNGPGTNHDDPCFWANPEDPARSLLFMTAKSSGLVEVFQIPAGTLVGTIPGFSLANNCWVEGDLLLTTDTRAHEVKAHHLPDLTPAGRFAADTLRPMGIATLHTPDGRTLVYVTDESDASVHVYDLASRDLVRTFFTGFGVGSGARFLRIEPVVADDRYQRVFIAREEKTGHGIGLFTPEGTLVRQFGGPIFAKDTEGLALYTCGEGGYLIASDQGLAKTEFEVFDRVTLDHLGTFTMQDGAGEYTSATDGIEILQTPIPGFPNGLLAACDGCGDNLPDQTDVMAWEKIAVVMGLDLCPGGGAPDCRSTPCMRRIFPSADASVLRETPDLNVGGDPGLVLDASPDAQGLLRFEVPDLHGFDLERAILRLTVDTQNGSDSGVGGLLYATAGDWDERTVTYTTRPPPLGGPIASAGPATLAQAVDFDVLPFVRGAGTQGLTQGLVLDFLLRTTSADRIRYRSREAGQSPPTLLLALHASTPPDLRLTSPEDGALVAPGAGLSLSANAEDAEDGDLTAAIRWRSDREGGIGRGGAVTVATLGHGRHTLEATVTDGAGLQAASSVRVLVDSAPVLAVDDPADGTRVAGGTTIALAARATDAEDGPLTDDIVWRSDRDGELGVGGTLPVTLSEGTHRLTATVRDADGLEAESTRTLVVTPTAPVVTIVAPVAGTVGVAGDPVAFAGQAFDLAEGDLAPQLSWESDLQGTFGSGARLTLTGLVPGTHVVTARVTDRDGLTGEAQVVVRVLPATLVLPAQADAFVRADFPTTNYGTSATLQAVKRPERQIFMRFLVRGTAGAPIARATLRLTVGSALGSAGPSGGTIAPCETSWDERLVTYQTRPALGAALGTAGAIARGQVVGFDVTPAVTGDGPVAFALTSASTDTIKYASREALSGRPTLVLALRSGPAIPDTPPTVTITAPADGDVAALGTPLTFAATVTDADDPDLAPNLAWSSDLTGPLGTGTPLVVPDLPPGAHVIRAQVVDHAGNQGVAQLRLVVNAPPRVAITAPADDLRVDVGTPVALAAEAADPEDGDLGAAILWSSDRDGALGRGATLTVPALSIGTHHLTATVADSGGASATAARTVTVTPATLLLPPVADATVKADSPATRFGASLTLQADATPVRRALLRFVVSGVGRRHVTAATLRLTVAPEVGSGSVDGGTLVRITPTPWQESKLTFTTAPAPDGPVVAALGRVADGQAVTADLSSVVTGDGGYELVLVTASTDRVAYSSREAGPDGPLLTVTFE